MDKKKLGEVLTSLNKNQTVQLQMRGRPAPETYRVVESKRGRGKGGSRVATFQRDDGTVITVGTPKHLDVLNISVDGNFYGITDERQEPFIYPVNEEMAVNFKTAVKTAIGKNDEVKLQLTSSLPYLNGTFRVANSRNEKGKHGQLHLWLIPDGQDMTETNTVEIWSHRHSGVIQSFQVL
jgi:hypothetical protein